MPVVPEQSPTRATRKTLPLTLSSTPRPTPLQKLPGTSGRKESFAGASDAIPRLLTWIPAVTTWTGSARSDSRHQYECQEDSKVLFFFCRKSEQRSVRFRKSSDDMPQPPQWPCLTVLPPIG